MSDKNVSQNKPASIKTEACATDKAKDASQCNTTATKPDVFGKEAVNRLLADVTFPVSKQDFIKHFGNQMLEYRKNEPVRVEDVIKHCECKHDRFESKADLTLAMCKSLDSSKVESRATSAD